jgi:hypothetical protein
MCPENQQNCQTQTINNIKHLTMPHVIDQDYGPTVLIQFPKPTVNIANTTAGKSTTTSKLISINHVLNNTIDRKGSICIKRKVKSIQIL